MGLESEVVETFLGELRKDGKLKESAISQLQELLKKRSITQENLLELIRENADSKGKNRKH